MYNKTGIKRLAFAIIAQALEDLTLNGNRKKNILYRESAHVFFKSDFCKACAEIADINILDDLYNKYKKQRIKIRKHYKKKQKHYIPKHERRR